MRRPSSFTGRLANLPVVRQAWLRRALVVLIVLVCAVLALFPQHYRAVTSLTPSDPGSLGLGGAIGQLGAGNSVFGNQAAIEVSLKIAQSPYVGNAVMRQLDLPRKLGRTPLETLRWLDRKVETRVMRGGIIQIETTLRDPDLGAMIVTAYADQLRARLAAIARNQTAKKREILVDLTQDANDQLAKAQSAYDAFRLRTHYSAPEASIPSLGERIPQLEAMVKSKQIELAAAQKFATGNSFPVRQIKAQLAALHGQLAEARSTEGGPEELGRVVKQSTEADRLKRDLDLAQRLYDGYKRYLRGTAVEELTADVTIRVLEPTYIAPERQYNWNFVALAVLVVLGGLAIEFYNLRPPVGNPEPA